MHPQDSEPSREKHGAAPAPHGGTRYSLLQEAVAENPQCRCLFFYSATNPDEFAFREELEQLATSSRAEHQLEEGVHATRGAQSHAQWFSIADQGDPESQDVVEAGELAADAEDRGEGICEDQGG